MTNELNIVAVIPPIFFWSSRFCRSVYVVQAMLADVSLAIFHKQMLS
jgi:hypothetical protein